LGLSFETLKTLKEKGINKILDIVNKSIYNVITSGGIYNVTLPYRDIKIIEKIKQSLTKDSNRDILDLLADEKYSRYIVNSSQKVKLKKKFWKK